MTVAPVPPSLGAIAAVPTPATPVVPASGVAAGAGAGAAQSGATIASSATLAAATPVLTALGALALEAATQAAAGEGGLAQLLADLSQAQSLPGIPGQVQSAIGQVLDLQAPLDTPPSAADIKAAVAPTDVATVAPATTPPGASAGETQAALTANGPLKNALVGLQQSLRNWLADAPSPATPLQPTAGTAQPLPSPASVVPTVADLVQALRSAGLPAPLQAAIEQLLPPAASPIGAAPTAGEIAPTPAQAGQAAAPIMPQIAVTPAEAADGPAALKLLVPALEAALQPLLDAAPAVSLPAPATPVDTATTAGPDAAIIAADPAAAEPMATNLAPSAASVPSLAAPSAAAIATPAAPEAVATNAAAPSAALNNLVAALPASVDPREVVALLQQVVETWFTAPGKNGSATAAAPATTAAAPDAGSPAAAAAPSAAATRAPPPPYRGGPTTAQPAVPSSLPAGADAVTVGARLLRETNAALAHQQLLQIASLPTVAQGPAPNHAQNPQWMFEIPFATPQGSAVAQFKISRDGGRGGKGKQAPVWRAQFSLDVEPMGPVHAQVVLAGDRTWVSLWAERADSVARLRESEGLLTTSLKDANFVAEIAFHAGAPRQTPTAAGYFLNRAS